MSRESTPLLALVVRERAEPAPDEGPDEVALVAQAVDGDRWAEEALYRLHARVVTDAVVRMVGRHADADDIVQDTFIVAFERLETLRDRSAFRAWVVRIAINRVRGHLRRRRFLRVLGLDRGHDDAGFAAMAVDGARPDLRAELVELDGLLNRLPPEERIVWVLHRVEGWSLRETAEALECSTATLKRRLSAADAAIEIARSGRGWRV